MIRSMTGYGRGEALWNGHRITAEIRSVNNRYLDCTVKLPRAYLFAEDPLRKAVQARVSRGKVEVYFTVSRSETSGGKVSVDLALADSYFAAVNTLKERYKLNDATQGVMDSEILTMLTKFPDVLQVEQEEEDRDSALEGLLEALGHALDSFEAMRGQEGEKLRADVLSRGETITDILTQIETRAPGIAQDYREKLTAKLRETLESTTIEESRILTEAAIYADKVAIDEETVRLRSHLTQLRGMLDAEGSIGRKLDFLIQEFNREANTIGSKCSDLETSRMVVDMKAEIEKIREQVQNIE